MQAQTAELGIGRNVVVVPDIGACVVRLLARPLVLIGGFDETPRELRAETRSAPKSTHETLQANAVRIPAWVMLGLLMLLVGLVISLAEPAISTQAAEHAHSVAEGLLVTFFVIAVLEAVKVGVAHYSRAREIAGSPLWYRLVVVPGNADVVVAALLVGVGYAAGS